MRSSRWPERAAATAARCVDAPRRRWLAAAGATTAGLVLPAAALFGSRDAWAAAGHENVAALLKAGGCAIAFRHALAPGTFDPPGFKLGECSTQRNLNDEGRDQARRIGAWFKSAGLVPAAVRSSPWCRCVDTANLAFGKAETWAALGSPVDRAEAERSAQTAELRRALAALRNQRGRFEAWVTHEFVLQNLAGETTSSAEALVLQADAGGAVRVLARASLH